MVPSLRKVFRNFVAVLNVLPLSDKNLRGSPSLAANLFKHHENVSVDKLQARSMWMAQVTRQVKTQIHALEVLVEGPCNGEGGGPLNGAPSNLLKVVHLRTIVLVSPLPLTIQYWVCTSVRVSFTPL